MKRRTLSTPTPRKRRTIGLVQSGGPSYGAPVPINGRPVSVVQEAEEEEVVEAVVRIVTLANHPRMSKFCQSEISFLLFDVESVPDLFSYAASKSSLSSSFTHLTKTKQGTIRYTAMIRITPTSISQIRIGQALGI